MELLLIPLGTALYAAIIAMGYLYAWRKEQRRRTTKAYQCQGARHDCSRP
jgi:hypothetical protein